MLNLLVLAHLTNTTGATERIERTFRAFSERLRTLGRAVPMMLTALSTYHAGMPQIVLVGDDTGQMRRVLAGSYLPTSLLVPVEAARRDDLARLLPWIAAMTMRDGKGTAYVCRDFACQAPVTSADDLAKQVADLRG